MPQPGTCDLCGLRLSKRHYSTQSGGRSLRFCCSGCRQVFVLVQESGPCEGDYKSSELYQTSVKLGIIGRPEMDAAADESSPQSLAGCAELVLRVDGMWCSSCGWLIEKVLSREPGVVHSRIMYASDTAKIYFRPESTGADEIKKKIESLGYPTAPRDAGPKELWAERKHLLLRMGIALFLMSNLMLFSYALYIGYVQELPKEILSLFPMVLLGFALPSVFWCGLPIHRKAWQSVKAKSPTMELLFSLGIFAAFFYSVYELLSGGHRFYFDTAGNLVGLLLVGKFIELSAKHKTSEGINRLYQMLPTKVRLVAPEGPRLVSIDKLQIGDRFIVKSGEKIPADGFVVDGTAIVDESLLTGESNPIEKHRGVSVIASSMNVNGFLEIEATRIGQNTTLSSIIKMVERALTSKSELERTVDKLARVFIPAILTIALVTCVVLVAGGAGLEAAILRSISVLVIACPCALGMATPLAVAAGIGYAASRGILIRDSASLQLAGKISNVVFDKTGTLTEGRFALLGIHGTKFPAECLRLAASLDQVSGHPVAAALVDEAANLKLPLSDASEIRVVEGMGISGIVQGKQVVVGNRTFVRDHGFAVDQGLSELIEREASAGHTIVFCGIAGEAMAGYFVLGDSMKSTSVSAIEALTGLGISTSLLSGDMEKTTSAIARRAGVGSYTAQALPSDKRGVIAKLQAEGKIVAMVGDGVNDAPALAQADVGIAMGAGAEIATESAAIVLLRDDLGLVGEAIAISRRSFSAVKQNLIWAYVYNSIGIVLAVLGYLNPFMAAIAMLASSISVVLNSLRVSLEKGVFARRVCDILFPWIEPGRPSKPPADAIIERR